MGGGNGPLTGGEGCEGGGYTVGKQPVGIGITLSSFQNVTCGVPEGWILGPLLLLGYAKDMCSAVNCNLLLYADDSAIILAGKM